MSQERQFAWAPDDTPEWLRTRPSDVARGGEHFVEIDEAIGGEVPEELLAKGWGRVPQSMWDALLSKLSQENLARALYFHALQDDADHHNIGLTRWDARALGYIHVLHNGSPVWWIDLDGGDAPAVAAVTLFDLVVGTRQPAHDDQGHTQMWMLSLDQWDNAEWPAESQGGPPYTKSVSVAREAQDRMDLDAPWPPAEADAHGVLHTQIEMPKGPPRWLGYGRTPLIAVRINTYLWGEILRADGYAAWNAGNISSETPEESIERHARFLLDILEGARRTEGDGSLAPNNVYIDAAHYFEPRVRFLKYGSGDEPKRGMWAGLGFFKKESIRELLTNVIVTHEGSTVWLYDLEAGKPDRVLTLWEMIGDWFGDINDENLVANRVGARKIHGGFGPVPIYFFDFDTKKVRGYYDVETKKKLWPMSEAQWESGEWPSVDVGGPPAAKYGMEASEPALASQQMIPIVAPSTGFPGWLLLPSSNVVQVRVEFSELEEILREDGSVTPLPSETLEEKLARMGRWFVRALNGDAQPVSARSVYGQFQELLLPRKKPRYGQFAGMSVAHKETAFRLFRAVTVTHKGSTVWLYDLDAGKPDRVLTLFELAQEKWYADGASTYFEGQTDKLSLEHKKLWPMSEAQWESGEWPQEGSGGPPAARYGMEAAEAAREKYVDPEFHIVVAPQGTPKWLIGGHFAQGRDSGDEPQIRVRIPEENDAFTDPKGMYFDWHDFTSQLILPDAHYKRMYGFAASYQKYHEAKMLRRSVKWEKLLKDDPLATGLGAIDIFHGDSPVWWTDLDSGPVQAATLFDLAGVTQPATLFEGRIMQAGLATGRLWLMSLDQWDNAEWPAESQGGPPYTPHVSVSRENPMAAEDGDDDAALICMGRHIILELEDCDDVELPARWGMLHDPSGIFWPKCSLLFCKFSQGQQSDSSDEGVGYFGKKADVRRGRAHMPLPDLHNGWHEVGIVKQVFYERAGKHEGRYKHKFNDPRGWMWLVALFKRRVAETPPILFEYNCGGLQALRLELPDGCAVDDRGIALP